MKSRQKKRYLDGGIKEYPNGIYEGNFKDESRHGYGKMTYSNGEIYTGEWKNDMRNGEGFMIYPCNSRYIGDWEKHEKSEIYAGQWENDMINGLGFMKYSDGTLYKGEWTDNKRNGNGITSYNNGYLYEGKYTDDKKDGIGRVLEEIQSGKTTYTATWENGKLLSRTITIEHNQRIVTYMVAVKKELEEDFKKIKNKYNYF